LASPQLRAAQTDRADRVYRRRRRRRSFGIYKREVLRRLHLRWG
jgi:hypothetical protein